LDGRARTLGQTVRSESRQLVRLTRDAADLVAETFAPLVRIESTRGKQAMARVRAGGLLLTNTGVSFVGTGDVLQPVIRRNDRLGEPRPGGIQVLDWTYLLVREKQEQLLECDVYSALRNPLGGRSSPSLERLALKSRPRGASTTVQLVARGTPDEPLQGYAVFARQPATDEEGGGALTERLGITDWQGSVRVDVVDSPLRILYVKNGTHLLARLPIVPGAEPWQRIALPSDDKRLEAEAFVRGMENSVMDLVARREILAVRIRSRIQDGRFADARQFLNELKSLPTKEELEMTLASRRQAGLAVADESQLRRIDQLLNGTRILLNRHLNPQLLVALEREIDAAEKTGKPTPGTRDAVEEVPASTPEPVSQATN
jgi:hypothetical protein